MKSLKVGNAILCEYVARGNNRKHTLVNAYSGDVLLSKLPAQLQFGIYVELPAQSDLPQDLILEFKIGKEVVGKVETNFQKHDPAKPTLIVVSSLELGIEQDTIFSVLLKAHNFKTVTVIRKRIFIGPSGSVPIS